MLLDNEEKTDKFSAKRLNRIYSVLTIIGLIYGCFIFANYCMISNEVNSSSPFLPKYTASYIYGIQAFKGVILLAGMTLSQVTKWFHLWSAVLLLVLAIVLTIFSDWIYLSYQ